MTDSKNLIYTDKAQDRYTGVFLEVTLAKSISKKIENYVLPLKVDGCSYDYFPISIRPLDTIDFSSNLGKGLKELIELLELQSIQKVKI